MKKYEQGKTSAITFKTKAVKGWKRFAIFANATALAVVAANAIKDALPRIQHSQYDVWTVILTISGVLIALTAAAIYIRFFTEDN